MGATVVFPDIADLLVTYLAEVLPTGTYVGIVRPSAIAGRNVVIVRPNGGTQPARSLRVENVAVTVFAPDDGAATDLAEQVVSLLGGLEGAGRGITAVIVQSAPSPVIDDSLVPSRYCAVQFYIRGSSRPQGDQA